ncbi:MAG: protein arginine kinase [bacterium]
MSRIRPQTGEKLPGLDTSAGKIDDLLWNFGNWLTNEDEFSDTIISSRIRLARNLKDIPFPNKACNEELTQVLEEVKQACKQCRCLKKANYVEVAKLSEWDCKYFVERRLASPQLIDGDLPSMLIIGSRENLSIMVNEEDHVRMQCIEAGLGIQAAWKKISSADDELAEILNFSFSKKFGYLTACPTNIGTGMRVSIFVHLPALSVRGEVESVIQDLPSSEIAVRGFYGEGTESIGNIYQVSNQLTLGRTEKSVVERILFTAKKLTEMEREARSQLLTQNKVKTEDMVYRAMGILENARIMTSLEAMNLLSTLRLGCELGLVDRISRLAANQLIVLVQPAHLQRIYDRRLDAKERDIVRAEFIRQNLHA